MRKKVDELMDLNQPLQAWELVKDSDDFDLKTKVWNKVIHAFDDKLYRDYYENKLTEIPVSDEIAFDCTQHDARFRWLLPKIMEIFPDSVLDVGCADGYLGLTLGRYGIKSVGLNLYKPSIQLARQRAKDFNLPAKFEQIDFRDYTKQHQVIVFFEILEHVPNPKEAIKKTYSLVKDGGYLFISTPRAGDSIGVLQHMADTKRDRWDIDDSPAGHLRLFTEKEIKELIKPYTVTDFYIDIDKSFCIQIKK